MESVSDRESMRRVVAGKSDNERQYDWWRGDLVAWKSGDGAFWVQG